MEISLGANPFFWPKHKVFDYYESLIDLPIDRVYLGETVCAKRRELRWDDWLLIADLLSREGKQVVLSSYTLLEAESEVSMMQRVSLNDRYLVEANDVGAIDLLTKAGRPFVIGSAINVYNHLSLDQLVNLGAETWVVPVELSRDRLSDIIETSDSQVSVEMLVHGYLPLAYSARCFAARHHGLPKDDCQWVCQKHPYGLPLDTQDNQKLFRINGIQTLSGHVQDLSKEVFDLMGLGINRFRVSPSEVPLAYVVEAIQMAADGMDLPLDDATTVNGYFHGVKGMGKC